MDVLTTDSACLLTDYMYDIQKQNRRSFAQVEIGDFLNEVHFSTVIEPIMRLPNLKPNLSELSVSFFKTLALVTTVVKPALSFHSIRFHDRQLRFVLIG
jgi:hypothetical protein